MCRTVTGINAARRCSRYHQLFEAVPELLQPRLLPVVLVLVLVLLLLLFFRSLSLLLLQHLHPLFSLWVSVVT